MRLFGKSYSEINTDRVLMIFTIIAYPIIGIIFTTAYPELYDPIEGRLLFSNLILIAFISSYLFEFFKLYLHHVLISLFYLLTIHSMYLCVVNNFFDGYKFGLIVLISATGIIFKNKLNMAGYAILVFGWMGWVHTLKEELIGQEVVYFSIIILAVIISFIFVHLQQITQQGLLLSNRIVQNANSFILMFNIDGELVFANPIIGKVLGYSNEELLGDGWWKVRNKNPIAQYTDKKRIKALIQGEKPSHFDYRNAIYSKWVDLIWIDWQISIIDNQLVMIGNDITSAILFKKKHNELSIAAQNMSDLIIVADQNDEITWVNDAFTKITGYTFREALGQNPRQLLLSENCPPRITEYIENKIEEKKSFNVEILNKTKSGEDFWNSIRVSLLKDVNGNIENYITVGHDVTEIKKSNEQLKHYLERISIMHDFDKVIISSKSLMDIANFMLGIIMKSINGCDRASYYNYDAIYNKVVVVKDVGHDELNFQYNTEIDFDNFPSTDKLLNGEKHYVENLSSVDKFSTLETIFSNLGINSYLLIPITYNGSLVSIINIASVSSEPFKEQDMQMINEITVEFSIALQQQKLQTSIKDNNKSLALKNNQLLKLNDELTEFSYIVSHDLKSPLRSIMTLTDFISIDHGEKIGESGKEQLNMLKGRTQRMYNLIEGIVEYSQIGNEIDEISEISFKDLLDITLKDYELPTNVELNIIGKEDSPIVSGDILKIVIVLDKLLSNALKYCNQKKGVIEIGCSLTNNICQFHVSDNGKGIDKKHKERIFKLFKTLVSKNGMESTGIGLTIAKKIIELHDGEIWFESQQEKGTTFYFTIPNQNQV